MPGPASGPTSGWARPPLCGNRRHGPDQATNVAPQIPRQKHRPEIGKLLDEVLSGELPVCPKCGSVRCGFHRCRLPQCGLRLACCASCWGPCCSLPDCSLATAGIGYREDRPCLLFLSGHDRIAFVWSFRAPQNPPCPACTHTNFRGWQPATTPPATVPNPGLSARAAGSARRPVRLWRLQLAGIRRIRVRPGQHADHRRHPRPGPAEAPTVVRLGRRSDERPVRRPGHLQARH